MLDCVIVTIGATPIEPKQKSGRSAAAWLLLIKRSTVDQAPPELLLGLQAAATA
jgi:hypothetical protein